MQVDPPHHPRSGTPCRQDRREQPHWTPRGARSAARTGQSSVPQMAVALLALARPAASAVTSGCVAYNAHQPAWREASAWWQPEAVDNVLRTLSCTGDIDTFLCDGRTGLLFRDVDDPKPLEMVRTACNAFAPAPLPLTGPVFAYTGPHFLQNFNVALFFNRTQGMHSYQDTLERLSARAAADRWRDSSARRGQIYYFSGIPPTLLAALGYACPYGRSTPRKRLYWAALSGLIVGVGSVLLTGVIYVVHS